MLSKNTYLLGLFTACAIFLPTESVLAMQRRGGSTVRPTELRPGVIIRPGETTAAYLKRVDAYDRAQSHAHQAKRDAITKLHLDCEAVSEEARTLNDKLKALEKNAELNDNQKIRAMVVLGIEAVHMAFRHTLFVMGSAATIQTLVIEAIEEAIAVFEPEAPQAIIESEETEISSIENIIDLVRSETVTADQAVEAINETYANHTKLARMIYNQDISSRKLVISEVGDVIKQNNMQGSDLDSLIRSLQTLKTLAVSGSEYTEVYGQAEKLMRSFLQRASTIFYAAADLKRRS